MNSKVVFLLVHVEAQGLHLFVYLAFRLLQYNKNIENLYKYIKPGKYLLDLIYKIIYHLLKDEFFKIFNIEIKFYEHNSGKFTGSIRRN